MEKIEQIKSDLRQIRRLSHSIDSKISAKERLERQKAFLKDPTEIDKIERVISSLCIEEHIAEASALEQKYISAIGALSPTEQIIIIDSYFNGLTYWQIGRRIGYSESGIKKRINKIIENLANIIKENGED